ncbi:D-alanyl-D-alanine carboxypeptidase family protein [Aurantimonas sp. HBX-1]|uniref:D-alanyl-D-alanine carboxypeptidase family protein n=1 Tax=Aurantimonas sp. HBX-1 TaxID=2906072 RepID=UPI001F282509|nr:D-alanyl-D-alanine carboxypeptidase family protein [Aurantimonas sp. HBX-1]UIJ73689.1 D-alanyl-D-alanine carboxypeptidase [Aurantimonas sp. HBX-1]
MFRITILTALVAATVLVFPAPSVPAQEAAPPAVETTASEVLLVDGETGTILFQKNPAQPFPPASLAKIMTMEIVFAALRAGEISLDTTFPVSEHAWRTGGAPSGTSTMFAALNSQVPVADLIRGTIVQAANDAAIILAEGMEGSEAAFAERMNERAAELGLTNSHFVNPTGLPAEGQQVTVTDLVKLARHMRNTYPDLYAIYAEPSFEWNKIFQRNRNPLLSAGIGADGLATGYTEASGYALLGATEQDGRVTYLAMSGLESERERAAEAIKLLGWARDSFEQVQLFEAGTTIGTAGVFGGTAGWVPAVAAAPVSVLLPVEAGDRVRARIRYDGPLIAPVAEGDPVATLDVLVDGEPVLSQQLVAGSASPTGSFADRALGAAKELAFGWVRAF